MVKAASGAMTVWQRVNISDRGRIITYQVNILLTRPLTIPLLLERRPEADLGSSLRPSAERGADSLPPIVGDCEWLFHSLRRLEEEILRENQVGGVLATIGRDGVVE